MTPPKVDKVDIRPLDTLYLENLMGLEPAQVGGFLKGSDLAIDTKTGELQRLLAGGQTESRSLDEEISWVQLIREADTNGDKFLDATEVQKIFGANLAPDQAKGLDPQKFLDSIDELMRRRYGPISANVKSWQAKSVFGPTLDALKLYNQGIRVDEVSLAHRTLSFNAVGKTATNALFFIPSAVHNIWGDSPLLMGDAAAESSAERKFQTREEAVQKLETVINQGLRDNEAWALEGKLDEALLKLDSGTRDILNTELCASMLHRILTLPDAKERYSALLSFAEGERPNSGLLGIFGYGGGNSHMAGGWWESLWNLTGRRNNLFFAKTIFRFLAAKAATQDPNFDQSLDQQSRAAYSDMLGDGGGYMNMASVGLTNVLCLGGLACEPTQYRDWSDEARMDGLGRGIDGALMVWGGSKAFTMFEEGNRLRGLKGTREVFKIWRREGSLVTRTAEGASRFRPFPVGAWREAANAAAKEAEIIGQDGKALAGGKGRFARALDRVTSPLSRAKAAAGEWLFKGLPALSPRQLSMLKTAAQVPGKGLGKLVKGVMILGIVQYGDSKLSPAFNPFEYGMKDLDREASFDAYPDLTKPDPILHPAPKSQ
ncbi:MAG: hypothetical protein K8R69_12465 [Deltaproteobacteria bacterium]|nr:hypothetical protein [Deltaproteobacteria bacterium]